LYVERPRLIPILALSSLLAAAPAAHAEFVPYLRATFGVSQLAMTALDAAMLAQQSAIRANGGRARFDEVGMVFGPELSAGVWLLPSLRVGTLFSWQHRNMDHSSDGSLTYVDLYEIRTTDAGAELAFRLPRYSGLTIGGQIALTQGEVTNNYRITNASGSLHVSTRVQDAQTTWGVFIGLDQTDAQRRTAGYLRLGYRFRDFGAVPGTQSVNDGSGTVSGPVRSVPLDFSGWYASLGIAFDAPH
jgi:hypothetical protein